MKIDLRERERLLKAEVAAIMINGKPNRHNYNECVKYLRGEGFSETDTKILIQKYLDDHFGIPF